MEKEKSGAGKQMVVSRVAPGLVFNFRWQSPSLSERRGEGVKSIFREWGQNGRERRRWEVEGGVKGNKKKKSRSNKPDSHGEEVWKWRLGGEKSHSGAGLHVLVILSPLFLSVLCLGYLQSPIFFIFFSSQKQAHADNSVRLWYFSIISQTALLVYNEINSVNDQIMLLFGLKGFSIMDKNMNQQLLFIIL